MFNSWIKNHNNNQNTETMLIESKHFKLEIGYEWVINEYDFYFTASLLALY